MVVDPFYIDYSPHRERNQALYGNFLKESERILPKTAQIQAWNGVSRLVAGT
jgi:hypothetical protein